MKDWIIKHRLYVIAAALVAFAGSFYTFTSQPNSSLSNIENVLPAEITGGREGENLQQPDQGQKPPLENMIVDVKGQVMKPGVYQANQGERIIDVIGRAGGLTELADASQVNFAEHVQDAMVIYIPAKGEEGPLAGGVGSTHGGSSNSSGKINLNKADENELQNLPGIGPAKAAAIIEYRETTGSFKVIEDLKNISGIGDKTFEKLKELIDVR
jgi:competence protein ComEA